MKLELAFAISADGLGTHRPRVNAAFDLHVVQRSDAVVQVETSARDGSEPTPHFGTGGITAEMTVLIRAATAAFVLGMAIADGTPTTLALDQGTSPACIAVDAENV